MAEKVQNLYRTPPVQPQTPQPVVRPDIRWTTRESLISALLVFFVVTAYFSVWRFEFVYFDDPGYISENLDVLRGLPLFKSPERDRKPGDPPLTLEERQALRHRYVEDTKASVYWAFTSFEQSNWHPLTWLSHMLDVQLYGSKKPKDLEPGDYLGSGGHHITNIILHSLNTLLFFGLFWRMTGKSWRSAAVAAMFAVHPMHVESVAWVAERKDVLSTFFGLLTLHAYVSYSRTARFGGGFVLFSATFAAIIGMLAWLWFNQCYWYKIQVVWFQQNRLPLAADVLQWFPRQVEFLKRAGFYLPTNSPDWYSQQANFLRDRHWDAMLPVAYDGFHLAAEYLAYFGTALILGLVAVIVFALQSGRTRLLKYSGTILAFAVVGTVMLAGLWSTGKFADGPAQRWINSIGGTLALLGVAAAVVAAIQRRRTIAAQCAVFACCVAALMIVLHWIVLSPPEPPAPPAWYNTPLQTLMERIWCSEFAIGLFIAFGSLAVDAVSSRRRNLALYSFVIVLYAIGLLAKPMLVTLPAIMLLIDFWPLGRMDVGASREEEKPAVPISDPARASRRRGPQRRRRLRQSMHRHQLFQGRGRFSAPSSASQCCSSKRRPCSHWLALQAW